MATAAASGANEKLAAELGKIVLARIASGRLTLPVMPEVVNRCLAHLRDPKIQQRKITAEIEREPLLAASLLRAALTASNAGANVKTLDQAISCLGLQKLKSLLVEFMARELFRSGDSRIQSATKQVWDHSIAVAILSRDIAALTGETDSDTCYLAGLLHDIGKPIIVAMLLEAERRLGGDKANWIDVRVWLRSVEQMHRQIGVALANEWKLPDEVVAVLRDCSEYDSANRGGAANIVRFANALAKREGFTAGPMDPADIDALIMVGRSMVGADDDVIARLVAGLPERVSQAA